MYRKHLRTMIYGKGDQITETRNELKSILDILNEINNPYIVIYDDVFTINNFTIAFVGEFFEVEFYLFIITLVWKCIWIVNTIIYKDGNLEKVIKKMIESKKSFSEERVFDFIFYLTDALKFLHEKKIIHKEIKPK